MNLQSAVKKMSSSSSSSASEEVGPSAPRVQRATDETLLRDMMCWLVSQGSKAMKEALVNGTELPPRTDLGDQTMRIAEAREITSSAYASGKPTRLKFWHGKFRRMKPTMRQKVDEHLDECSAHKNYKKRRDAIDALRDETLGSESSSPVRKSEKVATPEKAKPESVPSALGEKLGGILRANNSRSSSASSASRKKLGGLLRAKNSGSASDGAPGRKLGRLMYMENSEPGWKRREPTKKREAILRLSPESGLDDESPVKKREAILRLSLESGLDDESPVKKREAVLSMSPESGLDDKSPVKKRGRIDITKMELLDSDENPPSKKLRVSEV